MHVISELIGAFEMSVDANGYNFVSLTAKTGVRVR